MKHLPRYPFQRKFDSDGKKHFGKEERLHYQSFSNIHRKEFTNTMRICISKNTIKFKYIEHPQTSILIIINIKVDCSFYRLIFLRQTSSCHIISCHLITKKIITRTAGIMINFIRSKDTFSHAVIVDLGTEYFPCQGLWSEAKCTCHFVHLFLSKLLNTMEKDRKEKEG